MANTKEQFIIKAISDYLQLLENQQKLVFQRNNSFAGTITRRNGSVGYIKNSKRGASDFLIFVKGGKIINAEVKNEKGKQTTSQLEMELKLKQLGHIYWIVRGVDEVENLLQKYL